MFEEAGHERSDDTVRRDGEERLRAVAAYRKRQGKDDRFLD